MATRIVVVAGVLAVLVGVAVGWRFAFFLLPFSWTGEPERLARVLDVQPGQTVADIGAGNGAMAVAMARRVGTAGTIYATELSEDLRRTITERAAAAGTPHLRVVPAGAHTTNLPDEACDAAYLRMVLHHIEDRPAFARAVARALRPGGRLAIVDFAPGTLPFHGADHGVTEQDVTAAFGQAGLEAVHREPGWGGGTFLLVFERRARD